MRLKLERSISPQKWTELKERLLLPRDGIFLEELQTLDEPTSPEKTRLEVAGESGISEVFVFHSSRGPFKKYIRRVEAKFNNPKKGAPIHIDTSIHTDTPTDICVTETYDFKLAVVGWGVLLSPLLKHFLKRTSPLKTSALDDKSKSSSKLKAARFNKYPLWAPSVLMDARSTHILSILCLLAVIAGYLGSLLSQTITFVGDDLSADTQTQGYVLAIIRVGVILALFLTAAADKYGRKRLVGWVAVFGCIFTLLTAISPNIAIYALFQTLARALVTSFGLLLGIIAAEETPAGGRAYSVSVLAMSAALGAGIVVWLLPLADFGEEHWRILYLVPGLALLALVFLLRALPETTRFQRTLVPQNLTHTVKEKADATKRQRARLLLLGVSGFFLAIFSAPASQFQNEFLRDERGFSAAKITVFQIATNTPAGVGILAGGKIADIKGRRLVGAVGLLGGVVFIVMRYWMEGFTMWVWGALGAIIGAAVVPALGVYGPELFPTTRRGRFGGWLTLMGVAGSALGLVLVGYLSTALDSYGEAFAIVGIAPLIVFVLVLFKFPETAQVELENLNPEDRFNPEEGFNPEEQASG